MEFLNIATKLTSICFWTEPPSGVPIDAQLLYFFGILMLRVLTNCRTMFNALVKFAVSLARVTKLCRVHSARQEGPTEAAAADQSKREVGICIDTSIGDV